MSFLSFNSIFSTPVQCGQGEQSISFIFVTSILHLWRLLRHPFPFTIAIPTLLLGHDFQTPPLLSSGFSLISEHFYKGKSLGADSFTSKFWSEKLLQVLQHFSKCSGNLHVKYGRLLISKRWKLWDLCEIDVRKAHNWTQLYATSDGGSKAGGTTHKATFCMLQNFSSWQVLLQHRQSPAPVTTKRQQKTQICKSNYFIFVRNNCFTRRKKSTEESELNSCAV